MDLKSLFKSKTDGPTMFATFPWCNTEFIWPVPGRKFPWHEVREVELRVHWGLPQIILVRDSGFPRRFHADLSGRNLDELATMINQLAPLDHPIRKIDFNQIPKRNYRLRLYFITILHAAFGGIVVILFSAWWRSRC